MTGQQAAATLIKMYHYFSKHYTPVSGDPYADAVAMACAALQCNIEFED